MLAFLGLLLYGFVHRNARIDRGSTLIDETLAMEHQIREVIEEMIPLPRDVSGN